jgi:hypothetical protein
VPSLKVVEAVDVVGEDGVRLVVAAQVVDLLDFPLERREEALRDGIDAPMFVKRLSWPSVLLQARALVRSEF